MSQPFVVVFFCLLIQLLEYITVGDQIISKTRGVSQFRPSWNHMNHTSCQRALPILQIDSLSWVWDGKYLGPSRQELDLIA